MRKSEKRKYTDSRKRAEKQSTGFTSPYLKLGDGVTFFKPKAGVMQLDIVPFVAGKGNPWAEEGALHWEREFWVHRGIGANNDSFLCARKNSKSKCPICDFRAKLMKEADGDEDKEQMVKDLSPKQRQLINVINAKDPDKKVMLWDVSYHLFGKLLDARIRNSDEDDGWESFFFLEGGMTLKVGFKEESMGGYSYMEAETIDFKPRSDYDEDILEQVLPLDDILVETPYDELKAIFLEKEKDDEEDEDEKPKHKSKKPAPKDDDDDDADDDDEDEKPKKKSKPADDDDEDDDDDDDEDEKPRVKSKKEIDDEDDDDEDDEDEKPAPKKKSKSDDDDDDDEWDDFDDKKKKKK